MAGHSHYRRFNVYDDRTAALESGNYFNTVGWISYDIPSSGSPLEYNVRMLDANKATLESAATVPDGEAFLTERGTSLREDILSVRASMGLDEVLGCSPVPVAMSPSSSLDMEDEGSAWVRVSFLAYERQSCYDDCFCSLTTRLAGCLLSAGICHD
jgi:hypothetical protein